MVKGTVIKDPELFVMPGFKDPQIVAIVEIDHAYPVVALVGINGISSGTRCYVHKQGDLPCISNPFGTVYFTVTGIVPAHSPTRSDQCEPDSWWWS